MIDSPQRIPLSPTSPRQAPAAATPTPPYLRTNPTNPLVAFGGGALISVGLWWGSPGAIAIGITAIIVHGIANSEGSEDVAMSIAHTLTYALEGLVAEDILEQILRFRP